MLFDIPEFDLPFTARMHPRVDRIRQRAHGWVRDRGLLGLGIWSPESFEAADFGLFVALANPRAEVSRLDLLTDWLMWGWFVDDAVEPLKRSRNAIALKALTARMKALTPVDGSAPPAPVGPLEEALADLWARSVAVFPAELVKAMPRHIDDYVGGALWELHNDEQCRAPDPVDYVEMRRATSASGLVSALTHWAESGEVVPPGARELTETYADVLGLHNDIVSFEKDVVVEGGINNSVLAVRNFFGGELSDAVKVVNDLVTARAKQFQLIAEDTPALAKYAATLASAMAGTVVWSGRTGRYRASATPSRSTFHHPSGLGTAAVLVR